MFAYPLSSRHWGYKSEQFTIPFLGTQSCSGDIRLSPLFLYSLFYLIYSFFVCLFWFFSIGVIVRMLLVQGVHTLVHYNKCYNSIINKVLKKQKGEGISSASTMRISMEKSTHTKMDTKHFIS